MDKKAKYPRVMERPIAGTVDERCLSSPVNIYKLSPEEIEKKYGPVQPRVPAFHTSWPKCGEKNEKHASKKPKAGEEDVDMTERFGEEDYIDPEWGISSIKW